MVLLIGYDLLKPDQNYTELFDAIKSYGTWWHHLDSTWFIETNATPAQVRENLQQHLDENDKLLVIEVKRNWSATGFQTKAYDWLKARGFQSHAQKD